MKSLILFTFVGFSMAAPYWPKVTKTSTFKGNQFATEKAKAHQQFDLGSNYFSRSSNDDYDYVGDYVSKIDAEPSVEYQSASEFVQSYQVPQLAQFSQFPQLPLESEFAPSEPGPSYGAPPPQQTYGSPGSFQRTCSGSEVLSADGVCVEPEIIRNIFTFSEPEDIRVASRYGPPSYVPKPKIKFNLVVIQANEDNKEPEPIVIPPPQEKTVVLVLKKDGEEERRVIEVPAPAGLSPEVFFVNYKDGENPVLPGGIDLETALASSATQGTRINSPGELGVGGLGGAGGVGGQVSGSGLGGSGYNPSPRTETSASGFGGNFHDDFATNKGAY